jgi:hypothetical protein
VLATGDCHMHAYPGLHPPHSRREIAPSLVDPMDPAGQTEQAGWGFVLAPRRPPTLHAYMQQQICSRLSRQATEGRVNARGCQQAFRKYLVHHEEHISLGYAMCMSCVSKLQQPYFSFGCWFRMQNSTQHHTMGICCQQ